MTTLASLKFCNEVRPTPAFRASPLEKMRGTVLNSIAVQRLLVAQERGENVALTKTIRDATTGEDKVVARKPLKWFWRTTKGQFVMEMVYARTPVALGGSGKTVIDCGTLDGVTATLDILAEAVSSGALDKALTAAAEAAKGKTKAKAA